MSRLASIEKAGYTKGNTLAGDNNEVARKESRTMAKFTVCLHPAEEDGYIVTAPELPGCVTQGETRVEALEIIKDAIAGYIDSLKAHGDPLPPRLDEGIEVVEVEVAVA